MKRRKPSKQERQSRMTLTLTLSGCVFVVTLVTLLIIGAALLIVDRTGQLGKWMEHSSILSFFLIIAAISLVGGTLMALLLGTFPLRSVSEMTQGLHRLASGDYDVRIEPKGLMATIAPLRDMVESFNATASELAGTEMLRSDFINNFSHEFKTPIVSIAGFASLLRQGDLTRAEQLEYLDIIESESKRLADMATNVLNMTKVENQAILTDVSTFNLSEQLRTCVLLLERKWEKKNLEMNLDLEEYTVSGNQELLRQVWVNLLDNAIKFSPECQTVEVSALETENDVTVSICNTGSYIPPEQQEAIFRQVLPGGPLPQQRGQRHRPGGGQAGGGAPQRHRPCRKRTRLHQIPGHPSQSTIKIPPRTECCRSNAARGGFGLIHSDQLQSFVFFL